MGDVTTVAVPGVSVVLRDRTRVTVRPIRPEDAPELRAGFERLSPESRYRRFLSSTPRLSDADLRYLTEVDHHDHEALIAVTEDGAGVGVARFVRSAANPHAAEVAVTVVDEWQGRGVGTELLSRLADRARREGVRRFTALLLATNKDMLDLFATLGTVRVVEQAAGTVEIEIALPRSGIGRRLRELLRGSASGRFQWRDGRFAERAATASPATPPPPEGAGDRP